MHIILHIGMDVHSTNYTLSTCSLQVDTETGSLEEKVIPSIQIEPDYKLVLSYIDRIRSAYPKDTVEFQCGYEAGCLGYSLYHQLTKAGVKCVILAPTTMAVSTKSKVKKNDKRDAEQIAKCLAYGTYKSVYVPSDQDNEIKEYIRMRDDHKLALKKVKQQILAFCLRNGFSYPKNYWTEAHLTWLRSAPMAACFREVLDEYLLTYQNLADKLERMDKRIEQFAELPAYQEKVKKLTCLIGVKTHTAMATIVETGDFNRFESADRYSAFLGLVPTERSSGDGQNLFGITKAGNSHIRKLLIESAQCYSRGAVGYKSKVLKLRQNGNPPKVIAYADKANERLRRRYYHMTQHGKKYNVAKTAIARELACFIWGMMTEHMNA